jgi:hypothetical protein
MAQDTDTTPPPAPGPHLRQAHRRLHQPPYRTFNLEVEGRRTPRGREERWVETFDCFTDVDGGMWVALGQARTDMETARAVVNFLGANLRDDDGASMDYVFPATPELADPDDPDSDWLRGDPTEEEVARAARKARPGEPLYLGWDYELYPPRSCPSWTSCGTAPPAAASRSSATPWPSATSTRPWRRCPTGSPST